MAANPVAARSRLARLYGMAHPTTLRENAVMRQRFQALPAPQRRR
ncbi:hypothetical protein [Yoonia sp.]